MRPEAGVDSCSFYSRPPWDGIRPFGIETPRKLLAALGNPQNGIPIVHVAGTNGKGSVCALIGAMLHFQGYRVGLFTSPHLHDVTERCVIDGKPQEFAKLDASVQQVLKTAEVEGLDPSFFETIAAASFLQFRSEGVDWAVVEVGLGGRLDATNTIEAPRLSLITSVQFDHMYFLGDTLPAIAREKAGILRRGTPALCGEMSSEVRDTIQAQARDIGTTVEFFGEDFFYDVNSDCARFPALNSEISLCELTLCGTHQKNNAALAVRAALSLGLAPRAIEFGLRHVRWPGRLEFVSPKGEGPGPAVLLDAAHNPDGMTTLCAFLRDYLASQPTIRECRVVFAVMERKDWRGMLSQLRDFADVVRGTGVTVDFIFTRIGKERAENPEHLRAFVGKGQGIDDCEAAMRAALAGSFGSRLVVVTGSIYLLGRVRSLVTAEKFRTIALPSRL